MRTDILQLASEPALGDRGNGAAADDAAPGAAGVGADDAGNVTG